MGKAQKLFEHWIDNVPREVRVQDVKTFLNYYFPDMWDHQRSSHIVVRCETLKAFPDYHPYGEISVPVKGGQKVKGFYIKALLKAVSLLTELGDAP
ncbi:MAG: hypothetical protein JRG68_08235 [Deltaproteobacteria bacterium]|nr:hypothetical protein [Deltaproteobacteria bacterium]MBW2011618.1 hypothetical protein [Deltaproteobacteria bacterium]MBW2100721.1 hypothetical protein [Deltaproteobacteria bacterium]